MKIAVLNFSGNVGKSTIAAHLLKPRLGDAPIFSVDTINQDATGDGVAVEQVGGRQYGAMMAELLQFEHGIVDVGASNVEEWMKLLSQYRGSHEEFDFFVVPTVKERKAMADTINTILALSALGVPANRIRVVFNKVDLDESVIEEFGPLFGMLEQNACCRADPEAVVYANEVFELLKSMRRPLADVAGDTTDYRAKLRESKDPDEREHCARMIMLKRLAAGAVSNLDAVHARLLAA